MTLRPAANLGLLVLLAVGIVLVACGGKSQAPAPSPAAAPSMTRSTPASAGFAANGPLNAGGSEGAIAPPAAVQPPESDRIDAGGRRFRLPIRGEGAVLDTYGAARAGGMIHGGIDLQITSGGSVEAICKGKVLASGSNDDYGDHVELDCNDGWTVLVAYLSSRTVSTGDVTGDGTVIGRADSQLGFVHIELRWNGVPVDPAAYLPLGPLPTATAIGTLSATSTAIGTPSATSTGTLTPSPTATATATSTATSTPTVLPGVTAAATSTPTEPTAPTSIPDTQVVPTEVPTATATDTPVPTATPVPPTATNTATSTPIPPPTPSRTPTPRPVFE